MADTSYEVARARNPKWANPERNMIDLEVDFVPLDEEWLPYTASPTDVTCEHSRYLYTKAINGDYGDIGEYEHHTLWTPWYEDKTEVSNEALVQLLLEKGILSDDDVDTILVEKSEFKGFSRPATDSGTHNGGAYFGAT
tara:strand:- start:1172 stop:1588 length:417 start_codon:yes stop_codon:yes gene_type:complete